MISTSIQQTMDDGVWLPWSLDTDSIHGLNNGGPGSVALLEKMLVRHMKCGAAAVRLDGRQRQWAREIYDALEIPRLSVIGWNSLWTLPERYPDPYRTFMEYVDTLVGMVEPHIVCVDHEFEPDTLPLLPAGVRQIVDKRVGREVLVLMYRSDEIWPTGTGDAPSNRMYYLYTDPAPSMRARIEARVNRGEAVARGWPWVSMYMNAGELGKRFAPRSEWREVCYEIGYAGARGMCCYPSPGSKDVGSLWDNWSDHEVVFEMLEEGATMFRKGRHVRKTERSKLP